MIVYNSGEYGLCIYVFFSNHTSKVRKLLSHPGVYG
jgi:hypothetical protein